MVFFFPLGSQGEKFMLVKESSFNRVENKCTMSRLELRFNLKTEMDYMESP